MSFLFKLVLGGTEIVLSLNSKTIFLYFSCICL
jgi:hypothetical protein